MNKWQALLCLLDSNVEDLENTYCEAVIQEFELNSKISLPHDYKEFCRTFKGGGTFGDGYIDIYYPPNLEESNYWLGFLKLSIDRMRDWGELSELEHSNYENLLASAFIFGGSSRAEYIVWDLRTYRPEDDSYDIFLLCIDDPCIYLVGRDFFRFVRDFCLGTEALRRLPEDYGINPQEISFKFTR